MPDIFGGRDERPGNLFFRVPDRVVVDTTRSFEIGERIKAGGNGVVHRCTDVSQGYDYAIKFQLDLRSDRLERFDRETKLLADVRHDHLMTYEGRGVVAAQRVLTRGRSSPQYTSAQLEFFVMALAQSSLFESIRREASLPAIYFPQFRGLARALGKLHEKAVHRDIKPDNILIVRDRWVLSDYGLCDFNEQQGGSRLTPDWQVVGPRFWMSPEANNRSVGREDEINAASDVYQLASVFWYVVNRTHPTGILARTDWTGPEPLFEPIFKALHYDTAVRPRNGNEFADMIDAAILQL